MKLSKRLALVGIAVAAFGMFVGLINDNAIRLGIPIPFAIIGAGSLIALAITETKGWD